MTTDPITLHVSLDCAPAAAFDAFTRRIGSWWPVVPFSQSQSPGETIVTLEPHPNGRIFERAPDGTTHQWGRITDWNPPHSLAFHWHVAREDADATHVTVDFALNDTGGTAITLVHSGWANLGAEAQARRTQFEGGWSAIVGTHFKAFAEGSARD